MLKCSSITKIKEATSGKQKCALVLVIINSSEPSGVKSHPMNELTQKMLSKISE